MTLRPRIRIPVGVALAIVTLAYLYRAIVVRGGDFSLDRTDTVALGFVLVGIAAVGWLRHTSKETEGESSGDSPSDMHSGSGRDED